MLHDEGVATFDDFCCLYEQRFSTSYECASDRWYKHGETDRANAAKD